jgi:hypothetical protein
MLLTYQSSVTSEFAVILTKQSLSSAIEPWKHYMCPYILPVPVYRGAVIEWWQAALFELYRHIS